MAITAASVEANGWVLRLTVAGTPGSFAAYALDPDGTPKVTLTTTHPGFVASAGTAVPGSRGRTLVATKPLRRPATLTSNIAVLDETDNGDGTITCRLALSEFVHATETGLSLAVLAGWRSGAPGAAEIAVVNNSAFAAALPIFRWADASYGRVAGPVTLELAVFSHHPNGLAPVAAVRFTMTDGTNSRTAWATALSTSTRYGDAVRVYAVTLDPGAAPAHGAGLLRCDAEVYPWLGAMRSTDPAGTRSMTGLDVAAYGDGAQNPFVVGYDPAGTRYGAQVVFVDPVAGTTTAAAAMVKADLAAAKGVAPASRARDISTAVQALNLVGRTLAAANGQASRVRATDGARIVLAAGTHAGIGATAITTGVTSAELPVGIEGDPDDSDPRANVVLQTGTASNLRITKAALSSLSLEIGGTALAGSATIYWRLDDVEVRGKAGSEASGAAAFLGVVAGRFTLNITRSKWWRSGSGFSGSTQRIGLLRNCEWSRTAAGAAVLGGRFVPAGEDSTATGVVNGVTGQSMGTLTGCEDIIVAGCDLRSIKGRAWTPPALAAATAGTPNPSYRRLVFANNLCERVGGDPQPFWSIGEDESATISYTLIEGNSFVGERCNILYGDPLPTTAAEANAQVNQAFGNRVANNCFDWAATKHDAFNDPQTQSARGGGTGFRPQMTETWSVTYGVGFEGNHDFGRIGGGNFPFEYFGRRGVQAVGGVPGWPADRSVLGSPATGGGTYQPPSGSVLIGRGLAASLDRDHDGGVRVLPFAAGSLDAASAAELTPGDARIASRATAAPVHWSVTLAPAGGSHALGGREPVAAGFELVLQPARAAFSVRDIGAAVLPDLIFATPRMVRIEGEVRVQLINE